MRKTLFPCFIVIVGLTSSLVLQAASSTLMDRAVQQYRQKDFLNAAKNFYTMTGKGNSPETILKAKLYMGLSLYRLRLYQGSVFPLVEVAQKGTPAQAKLAVDYLIAAGDKLGETTLLHFALKRAKVSDIGETAKSIFFSRMAENQMAAGQYEQAIASLIDFKGPVEETNKVFYLLGLIYLKKGEPLKAVPFFERLISDLKGASIVSSKRGMAIMGLARAYYQAKKWSEAVRVYRLIPKDSPLYREALLELSWALFRSGQFRSAMTPLETLHSPFYQNSYAPESLLLRGVILLFICQFDQIQRVLQIYDSSYGVGLEKLEAYLATKPTDVAGYNEMVNAEKNLSKTQQGQELSSKSVLPFFLTRSLLEESDIRQMAKYLGRLNKEKGLLKKVLGNPSYRDLRSYLSRVVDGRILRTKIRMGRQALKHLNAKVIELKDISGQMGFLKYEMLNGQREFLRKKMSVDFQERDKTDLTRNYYIQNGYRYWPFEGEYWRDEIGNYQYFGANACE